MGFQTENSFGRVAAAMAVSAALCLALTLTSSGTNDMLFFRSYVAKAQQDGVQDLYRNGAPLVELHPEWTEQMAHPPAMLHVWRGTQALEDATGVRFVTWFRLLTLLAHLSIVLALFKLLGSTPAIWFALCPAAIMIGGFHGNSDPLVVAFLLWAVLAMRDKRPAALSGALFALAVCVKVWPLFLAPAFLLRLKTGRERMHFALAAAAVAIGTGLPYTVTMPGTILSAVFGYRSAPGWWGLGATLPQYALFGNAVAFGAVLVATVWLWKRQADLYFSIGTAIAIFLVLTPGFGVQYLEWVLPFCFVFQRAVTGAVYAVTSVFLFAMYTKWSDGFPWTMADIFRPGAAEMTLALTYLTTVCWLIVVLALISQVPGVLPGKRKARVNRVSAVPA